MSDFATYAAEQRSAFWVGVLVASSLITIASGIVALFAALGDREEAQRLEKRHKMIPMIGMIVSGVGLTIFAAWYFWPNP